MAQKCKSPASGRTGKASMVSTAANSQDCSTSFKFCAGNAGIIQRRIIRYLLDLVENQGFDRLPQADKLALAGTDGIRQLAQPFKNPLEYISKLRALNGKDCIWSVSAELMKLSNYGSSPTYYYIPVSHRQKWRSASLEGVHND